MTDYTPDPDHIVADETTLRALFPPTHELAALKCLDHLDAHARAFIARSPFLCLGTQDAEGQADVSPRGDPSGFVEVLGPRHLAIPDRPGNNRLDSLANITHRPEVGLLFLVPGYDETLRVNGTAQLSTDPELLARMAINDRRPTIAIVVEVTEVFLHCAKALRRSRLWDPSSLQDRKQMPSLMHMLLDQTKGAPEDDAQMRALDDALEEGYKTSMY